MKFLQTRDDMRNCFKKTALLALALAPLASFAAEDGVKIYGRVDIGPLYQSNAKSGNTVTLDEVSGNRWGFIGTEDLGNGNSAFFRLESRFYLDSGSLRPYNGNATRLWGDKAWVGLRSKTFGALSAGRVLTVSNTINGGGDTEAMTDSIGSMTSRKGRTENQNDNGLFYESPWFSLASDSKLRVFAQYAMPEVPQDGKPWGVGAQFRMGKFLLDGGYEHGVYKDSKTVTTSTTTFAEDNKKNSMWVGGNYNFDTFILKSTFATSSGYIGNVPVASTDKSADYRMKTWSVSLNKSFGRWDLGLMGTRKTEIDTSGVQLPTLDKVAVGYWYNFSKQTKLMPTIAYERLSGGGYTGKNGYGLNKDQSGNLYVQLGLRTEF
jgi:predicted porin